MDFDGQPSISVPPLEKSIGLALTLTFHLKM